MVKKFGVLNDIDKELAKRNTYQGFKTSILNKVRQLITTIVRDNDIVVDATIGNGKDTLFLSNIVKNGKIFGFDIQKEALENTKKLLDENNIINYELFNVSHELILDKLNEYKNKISLVLFNLGYLPNGDKTITTNYKSTIKAIDDSLKLLNNKGIIITVIYPGHEEGLIESIKIKEYLNKLENYNINEYHNTNNESAPYLISISKR